MYNVDEIMVHQVGREVYKKERTYIKVALLYKVEEIWSL